jgi:flagellar biosynthesis activator protein FlaF
MPNDPLEAYQSVERSTLDGRELEASLLMRAALYIAEVQQHWNTPDRDAMLDEALHYNQRLWTLFQAELLAEDNPMPIEIKQNLLSLSAFIDKRTIETLSYPEVDKLNILIDINRNLAAGLRKDTD